MDVVDGEGEEGVRKKAGLGMIEMGWSHPKRARLLFGCPPGRSWLWLSKTAAWWAVAPSCVGRCFLLLPV